MKTLILTLLFTFINFATHAASTNDSTQVIKVKGMVCSFCAQGIEKNFNAKKDIVKNTQVDLDTMSVTLTFHKGKSLPFSEIKKIIEGGGFNLREEK